MAHRPISAALVALLASGSALLAQEGDLPLRQSPIPQTTNAVHHIQLGVTADPALSAMLLEHVATFPGVKLGPTRVSLAGAVGFHLEEGLALAHPEVLVGGREFAHLHPDGSLHASLDPRFAQAAVQAGWAIAHPWAKQRAGWEGFVMIYTPKTEPELEVVLRLVEQSYIFVTGKTLK